MAKSLALAIAIVICACAASAPVIQQDKPNAPNQCFDGPFSIYRLNSEAWKPVAADPPLFFLKNPVPGEHPCVIVAIIVPPGSIIRYGYVDGQKFRSFMYSPQADCYKEEVISPEQQEQGKTLLLKLCKEAHCAT
jgi:hypothetical protein